MTTDHRALADAVRARIGGDTGTTDPTLRGEVASRAAGGPATDEPYDTLASTIGEASYRVTDAQLAAVRESTGSDKAAFEIVMCACLGAGLMRWDNALRALEEATDAPR